MTREAFYGILLAVVTTLGCLVYERIVKSYAFWFIILLQWIYTTIYAFVFVVANAKSVVRTVFAMDGRAWACSTCYVLSSVTIPLWFLITRRSNVAAGGVYEIAYLPLLLLTYSLLGSSSLSVRFYIGASMVIIGVVLISTGQVNRV